MSSRETSYPSAEERRGVIVPTGIHRVQFVSDALPPQDEGGKDRRGNGQHDAVGAAPSLLGTGGSLAVYYQGACLATICARQEAPMLRERGTGRCSGVHHAGGKREAERDTFVEMRLSAAG